MEAEVVCAVTVILVVLMGEDITVEDRDVAVSKELTVLAVLDIATLVVKPEAELNEDVDETILLLVPENEIELVRVPVLTQTARIELSSRLAKSPASQSAPIHVFQLLKSAKVIL